MKVDKNNPILPVYVSAPKSKHLTASRGFQGIPGVEMTPNGRLFATWYSGGGTEGPDNFVVLTKSDDHGGTWSEPIAVIDPPGRNIRAFDPSLWVDPQGRLWWFWAQCFSPKDGTISDGINGVWGIFSSAPDAENLSWSEPMRIADGVMMNKPTVLSDGTWALPAAVWANGIGGGKVPDKPVKCGANMIVSTDNGISFSFRGGVAVPERCYDEHMFIELNDARIWNLVRTNYGIGQSFSSDQGRTWTPGKDSLLGGPNSRFFIRRLKSGRMLLVNHAAKIRSHLTAYLSDDDGKTWQGGLLLDEREGVSYPDGFQDKSGMIWIIYDHQRYTQGDILLARFSEEDILSGHLKSQNSKMRILVSHSGGVKAQN